MLYPRISNGLENIAAASGRLQPALWDLVQKRVRTQDITEDGYWRFLDFDDMGDTAAGVTNKNGWGLHIDTGDVLVQLTTAEAGVLRPTTTTTDNNSIDAMYGGNVGAFHITSGMEQTCAFDCRVRFTQVTNTYNFFAGLTAAGSAADNGFFTDAGATADRGCVGFTVLEADGDALEYTHKKAGQTAVITSGLKALVVDTWYQLGLVFDPQEPLSARRIKLFIDNAVVGYVAAGSGTGAIGAATFPSAVMLNFGFALKNQTNVGKSFDIDCAAFGKSA